MKERSAILFCTDLDNTLIYSNKHDLGEDKINVEIYKEREITFVSARTRELLSQVSGEVGIVPVTTRTVEQYERIDLGICTPEYALTCNGGVLLVRGRRDDAWYRESLSMVSDCRDELVNGIKILEKDPARSLDVRFIEELFVFTKSEAPEKTLEMLRNELDESKVDLYAQGNKVYVVPKLLNKGTAVERLKAHLSKSSMDTDKGREKEYLAKDGADIDRKKDYPAKANKDTALEMNILHSEQEYGSVFIIAAGDSRFDLPMLSAADIGLAPSSLTFGETWNSGEFGAECRGKIEIMTGDKLFSEELLEYVIRYITYVGLGCH